MHLRILHIGLGPLGQRIIRDIADRGIGKVVAAVDHAPGYVGRRVGEIAGLTTSAEPDVRIVGSLDDVPPAAWRDIDAAIVTTTSDLAAAADTFKALLSRRLAVVSTCEELVWPYLRHPDLADELHSIAIVRGGRLLGAGVNPGFVMDALPLFSSAVAARVDRVEVWRLQDASTRRLPFQQKIGAGLPSDQFSQLVRTGRIRHVGLGESLHFLAHYLNLPVAAWNETIDPILADRPLHSQAVGRVEPGFAAGVRQVATATDAAGQLLIRLEFAAAIGLSDPLDRVRLTGEPAIDLVIRGGIHGDTATSAIILNAIEPLRAAPPGLHTMATIPMVHWRSGARPLKFGHATATGSTSTPPA